MSLSNVIYYEKDGIPLKASEFVEDDLRTTGLSDEKYNFIMVGVNAHHVYGLSLYRDIHYYDGRTSTKVADYANIIDFYDEEEYADVVVLSKLNFDDFQKILLSSLDIEYGWEILNPISEEMKKNVSYYLASSGVCSKIDISEIEYEEDYSLGLFNDVENHKIYFYNNGSENRTGDLYELKYDTESELIPAKLDEDVYGFLSYLDGNVFYTKNRNKETATGEIYVNGKFIEKDASWSVPDGKGAYVLENRNPTFTFKKYVNDDLAEIGKNILSYKPLRNGNVLILANYDLDTKMGDLCVWNKDGSLVQVDEKVYLMNSFYGGNVTVY